MADRISNLQDEILCHILSFMPTKQAIATSVLSRRWTHLWRSVPALDLSFRDEDGNVSSVQGTFRFNEFVYSVLLLRGAAQPIKRFCLRIQSEYFDFSNVNKWVNVVLQRKVEHLHVDVVSELDDVMPKLPISIFTCKTLVVLKLLCFTVKGFTAVELPLLKILRLRVIKFPDFRSFMLLLAGCPMLEDLQAYEITFKSKNSLTDREFKSLNFNKLTRADIVCSYGHYPLKAFNNLESLCMEIDKVYRHPEDIPAFHNLIHLKLTFLKYKWHLLIEVLKHCPKLQHLAVNEGDMDYKSGYTRGDQENWIDPGFVPECLSLHLRTCSLRNFVGLQGELLFAIFILTNARVLQTMKINGPLFPPIREEKRLMIKRELSSCPMSSPTCHLSFYFDYKLF